MNKIIYAVKVADLAYTGLQIFDVKIGQTTNIKSTLAQYRRSHREVKILDLWISNPLKPLQECEKGIHKLAEQYAYEREGEKFIFLQESYREFSENVGLLLTSISEEQAIQKKKDEGTQKEDSYTGKKPTAVKFKGKKYRVGSWRDVMNVVASYIYKQQEDFTPVFNIKGRKRDYFSKNKEKLFRPQKIKGSPYFFEGNISANRIIKVIKELLNVFGYQFTDLDIECEKRRKK